MGEDLIMRIFIVGGGFAGIYAAKKLNRLANKGNEVYLIDKNSYTTMLPNLPEIAGGKLDGYDITERIVKLIPKTIKFINEEVEAINLNTKTITSTTQNYTYDYLVLATGSVTNFYSFDKNLGKVNILESLDSAEMLYENFLRYAEDRQVLNIVISGAGFTGIELGCNLYDLSKNMGREAHISFIEKANKILPMLSEKLSNYANKKLEEMNFKIYKDHEIQEFDGEKIILNKGEVLEDVFFSWCSGVKSSLLPNGEYDKLYDGRIIVSKDLSIEKYPEVFVVGDSAAVKDKNGVFLRRGVNFAQMEGACVAKNIINDIEGKQRKEFKAIDLGWVIPIYSSSIGVAFGKDIKGRVGIFMHYIICGIKNYNFKNFCKEVCAALKYPFTKRPRL